MGFRRSLDFLPAVFRTETNSKFLNATLDQMISEPELKRLDGYVGRKFSPAYRATDGYIEEIDNLRQNYQLEPSTVYKDADGKVKLVSGYQDLLNRISSYGGITNDHSRLFSSDQYTFDGLFDYDKFANFSSYYWLPDGPDSVDVFSVAVPEDQTIAVTPPKLYQTVDGDLDREPFDTLGFDTSVNRVSRIREDGFTFTGYGTVKNPRLRLARGGTYRFTLDQIGHGFFIQTQRGLNPSEPWQQSLSVRDVFGVVNNGEDVGTITFNVPLKDAQDHFINMDRSPNVSLVAHSRQKNRALRYIDLQYKSYQDILTAHGGIDGQKFVDGKTIVFMNDPALDATPVAWSSYTFFTEGSLIQYGNHTYRVMTSFTTGRLFSDANLEIFSANGDWYDPLPFDDSEIGFDSAGFDRGLDVPEETRKGKFTINVLADGRIRLSPESVVPVDTKLTVIEGIKFGNRDIYRNVVTGLELVPNITANLDTLYYQDSIDENITGVIEIIDNEDNGVLSIDESISGLKSYTSPNGVAFTNGLKVRFVGKVEPTDYSESEFYVEGVGESIKLVPVRELVTPEPWLDSLQVAFDEVGFDALAFDAETYSPLAKDYIVINRNSNDRNAWSRINRWFHQDVINATAAYNNFDPVLDFNARAKRPIVEFRGNHQLFNFGKRAKLPVDLIDTTQLDAFSNIEGMSADNVEGIISTYFADGVPLLDGTRIVFTADQDENVRNKIYLVNWIKPKSLTDVRTAVFTGDGATAEFDLNFDVPEAVNLNVQIDGMNANDAGYQWSLIDAQTVKFTTPVAASANITISLKFAQQIHLTLEDDDIQVGDTVTVLRGFKNQGKQYFFDGNTWVLGQNKTAVNQPPTYDLVDNDGISFSDQSVYPSSNFKGNKVFGYQTTDIGNVDPELGLKFKYRTFNNIGDILFSDFITSGEFNYRVGVESIAKSTVGSRLIKNHSNGSVEYVNQWQANDSKTEQYQTQTYFATDYRKNLFPLNVIPDDRIDPLSPSSLLVYINNVSVNNDLFDIQLEGAQGFLLLDTDLEVGDKLDIRVATSNNNAFSIYEIPSSLEYNPLNINVGEFTLGQIRDHITKVMENTPGLRGSFIGSNNSRDLGNIMRFGGKIVQNLGSPHLANLFLNDTQANFVESVTFAQREYSRYKNKFLEALYSMALTNPLDTVKSVDEVIAEIGYNKSKMFPFFASDMLPYGEDYKKLTYVVSDPDVTTFDLTDIFDMTVPSAKSVLVYLNGVQLIRGIEYAVPSDRPVVEILVSNPSDDFNQSTIVLIEGDILEIREYSNTDGSYLPQTPAKIGMSPAFVPAVILDGYDTNPRYVIRGHDGSLTAMFGDHRDDALLELEKRIYNNIKVTYTGDLHDIRDYIPGGFRQTSYTKEEYDSILSTTFNTWLGKTGLRVSDFHTPESNDPWSWNYEFCTSRVDGKKMPAAYWRGIYQYYFDTDAPHLRPWEMLGFTARPDWWEYYYGPAPYTRGNTVLWTDLSEGKIVEGERKGYDARFARPSLLDYIPVDESGRMLTPLECLVKNYDSTNINGTFQFGDGGPVETAWRQSSEYRFAQQIALALMQPAEYFGANLDKNEQVLVSYGTNNKQWAYRSSGLRRFDGQKVHGEIVDGQIVRVNSYTAWIGEYVKSRGLDVTATVGDKLRNSTVQLSYKMAGYTDKKFIKVYADQATPNSSNSSVIIPDEDFCIVLNKSAPLQSIAYSGVIVTKTADGYAVTGYDDTRPYFTVETSSESGRREIIKVGNISATKFQDGNGQLVQVPYGTEFLNYSQVVDFLISYGRYLESVGFQFYDKLDEDAGFYKDWDLAAREFLFYVQQGWAQDVAISLSPIGNSCKFRASQGAVDGLTDRVSGTRVLTEDFKILRSNEYQVDRNGRDFSITINDQQGIYLLDLDVVNYEHILVFENTTRFNDVIYDPSIGVRQYRLKIKGTKTGDWDGSFGAAGFIINEDNIEEWQAGKNYYKGDIVKFKNTYYTAAEKINGSVEFDMSDWIKSDYSKVNKGLLPNLANKAGQFKTFYDVDAVNLELDADRLGKGLIGLRPRNYFEQLQIEDTSQAKFYQGMITQKGSRNSLDKLLRAKLDNFDGQVSFYEDWALRVGQYGATDIRQQLQIALNEVDAVRDPTLFEIIDQNDAPVEGRVSYKPGDIYIKPRVFSKNFLGTRQRGQLNGDLPNAGYVRLDDVNWTAASIGTLNESIDATQVKQGDRIAVAADDKNVWGVYRVDETNVRVQSMTIAPNGVATFKFAQNHNLSKSEVILIKTINNTPAVSYFYVVDEIVSNTEIRMQTSFANYPVTKIGGTLFRLTNQRFENSSEVLDRQPPMGWKNGDKLFVNSATDAGWGIYEKNEAYAVGNNYFPADPSSLTGAASTVANSAFGSSVSIDRSNNYMLVGQPGTDTVVSYNIKMGNLVQDLVLDSPTENTVGFGKKVVVSSGGYGVVAAPESNNGIGYVFVLQVNEETNRFDIDQVIAPADLDLNGKFGSAIAISEDGKWMAVGQPDTDGGYVYIYKLREVKAPPPAVQEFTASGSSGTFTLTGVAANPQSIEQVTVTVQTANGFRSLTAIVDYTLSGTDVILNQVPVSGSKVIITVIRTKPQQQFIADGSTSVFALTGDSSFPTSEYSLKISIDGKLMVPYVDYYLINDNEIYFNTTPDAGKVIVVFQKNHYEFVDAFTASDNVTGDMYGSSLHFTENGTRLIIGAPKATVSGKASAGKAYVYDRTVIEIVADGETDTFPAQVQTATTDVYLDGLLLTEEIGYENGEYTLSAGDVTFMETPVAGSIVKVENNLFLTTAILTAPVPETGATFGAAALMCPYECSVYVGSPYMNSAGKTDVGEVYRFVNQGRFYGSITGSVVSPTISTDGYLIINNRWIEVANGDTLAAIVAQINDQLIPGVSASANGSVLTLTTDSIIAADRLSVAATSPTILADLGLSVYFMQQEIAGPDGEEYGLFGKSLALSADANTLVVGSDRATSVVPTMFDTGKTYYDQQATEFSYRAQQSGAIFTYQYISRPDDSITTPGVFIPGQKLVNGLINPMDQFGASIAMSLNTIYVGVPGDDSNGSNVGAVFSFTNSSGNDTWELIRSESPKVNHKLVNRISLIDTKFNRILTDLDFIDPYKGKISGVAGQEISFRTSYDPAVYNFDKSGTSMVAGGLVWGAEHVGEVWWDISQTRWLEYEQGDLEFRVSNWGTAFPQSAILCYEWVESTVPPSQYVNSDEPYLYVRDNAYSKVETIDELGNIQVRYYFWAGGKSSVPAKDGRKLSVVELENLIANPKAAGIPYAAFVAPNAVALYNCKQYLRDSDIVLSIDYDIEENEHNIHAEYQLVSQGDVNSAPASDLIVKMIDSLAGADQEGRLVPDVYLPAGRKYGKDFRPRQSMFRNRTEAVRVAVEYINSVLTSIPVMLEKDTSALFAAQAYDREIANSWNEKVSDETEFSFLNTLILPIGHRVLVESVASVGGRWVIYELSYMDDGVTKYWKAFRVQSFNNADYLELSDWVKNGETSVLTTDRVIDFSYKLVEIDPVENMTVKIKNDGRGYFNIVKFINGEWTPIVIEKATVQIKKSIWDQSISLQGFDMEGFDLQLYDQWPTTEIQNILNAIVNDIFTDKLQIELNNWFFVMIGYVLQEQAYVDWVFKSSFIKVEQQQRAIKQIPVYQRDNQDLVSQYINETKPFHTKVREFVLKYSGSENSYTQTTDFDVPAYYIAESGRYRSPNGSETIDKFILDLDQYQAWKDNHAFEVGSIDVVNPGIGYVTAPSLTITGGGGQGATAYAEISNGQIVNVIVTNPGSGYTSTPTVVLNDNSGFGAALAVRLVNDKIRKIATTIKFDRVSTPRSSFLVYYKDVNGTPIDIRNEFVSRVIGSEGLIDQLLDTLSGNTWLVDNASLIGYPVPEVPDHYVFPDASGRVVVSYKQKPNGFTVFDLALAIQESNGGVNGHDVSGTEVATDDSFVSFESSVSDWMPETTYSPGDVVVFNGSTYAAANRFTSNTFFESDAVATKISNTTDEYVFNYPISTEWEPINDYYSGEYFRDPEFTDNLYRVDRDFISGIYFSVDSLVKVTGEYFESHLDRAWAYYKPTSGQLGRDLGQLFSGVEYPGVKIKGPSFSAEPGFDVAAFDMEAFDAFIIGPEGVKVIDPATLDQTIVSYFDDIDLGTRPEDIIIKGAGFVDPYASHAPEEMVPGRVYDTLSMTVYTNATTRDQVDAGYSPPFNVITYEIDRSQTRYSFASNKEHSGDYFIVRSKFSGPYYRNIEDAGQDAPDTVVSNGYYEVSQDRSYTIDWVNKELVFNTAPVIGDVVTILNVGQTGENIVVDSVYVGDGERDSFVVDIAEDLINSSLIMINGVETDDYTIDTVSNRTNIVFNTVPADGAHIHIVISNSTTNPISKVYTQLEQISGSSRTVVLDEVPRNDRSKDTTMLVELNGSRLRPGNSEYYKGDGSTNTFLLPVTAGEEYIVVSKSEVQVWMNEQRVADTDFVLSVYDGSTMTYVEFMETPLAGADISITYTGEADYTYDVTNNSVTVRNSVSVSSGSLLAVTTFGDHDVYKIKTKVFKGVSQFATSIDVPNGFDASGFDRTGFDSLESISTLSDIAFPIDSDQNTEEKVFLSINGQNLIANEDYTMDSGKIRIASNIQVTNADVIVVTWMAAETYTTPTSFRIFKDMNDKVTVHRVASSDATRLTKALHITDTQIEVLDASMLSDPSPSAAKPGIMFINGERITFWQKDGNVLKQIRRGTAGTGAPITHPMETVVVDGADKTLVPNAWDSIWYDRGETTPANGKGLQSSNTKQAKFLKASKGIIPW